MTRYAVIAQRGEVSARSDWYGTVDHTFNLNEYDMLIDAHFNRCNNGSYTRNNENVFDVEGNRVLIYSLVPCKDD